MTQMRDERIDALRTLSRLRDREGGLDLEAPQGAEDLVPASRLVRRAAASEEADAGSGAIRPTDSEDVEDVSDEELAREDMCLRLVGRLAPSRLADDSAWKASAEAPHSRLRIVFGKYGAMRFLGHRDLLRVLPRMFRRAGIEQAFSRGYNPIPRMSFGPALALGVGAEAEVVDVDVILPRSAEDLAGMLPAEDRARMAIELEERLRTTAPPGLAIRSVRLVAPDELRLGQLVAAADYAVRLTDEQAQRLAAGLEERLAAPSLVIERARHKKPRRAKHGPGQRRPLGSSIDVKATLMHAELQGGTLRFRLKVDAEGSARPREVVQALLGERLPDHLTTRERILVHKDGALVGIDEAGACPRPPARPRSRPAAEA
jgi:radical SAM-linked protein